MIHNGRFNPLNAELNPICHLLALLVVQHIFHVSGLRVKKETVLLELEAERLDYLQCPTIQVVMHRP